MKTEFLKSFYKDLDKLDKLENGIIEFAHVVHRKDIYNIFP